MERPRQREPLLGARDPDVAQAALLLDLVGVVHRARVREDALLEPGEEHRRELQALGRVQRHQRHARVGVLQLVDVAHQGDAVEEAVQRRLGCGMGEVLGGGNQFLQVLQPRLALRRALLAQGLAVAGLVEHEVDEGRRRQVAALTRQAPDQRRERLQRAARLAAHVGRGFGGHGQQRPRLPPGLLVEPAQRRGADATARRADGPAERDVVGRIEDQPQVGERVLDLAPLVEADAAHDDVRDAPAPQRVLQHPRLGVGAIEDGHAVPRHALAAQAEDRLGDERGLLVLVPGAIEARRVAGRVLGPQRLVLALDVVGDDAGGQRQDRLRRAIVLLEAHDLGARIVVLEVEDVADVRASPLVDRLIAVAHDAHVAVLGREEPDDAVLRAVGVLVLVDEHVAPEPAVVGEDVRDLGEEPDDQQQQVVEVDGARLAQALLVARVDERGLLLPRPPRVAQRLGHRDHLVLEVRDAVHGGARRERAVGQLALLQALLHERPAIILVVDRKV